MNKKLWLIFTKTEKDGIIRRVRWATFDEEHKKEMIDFFQYLLDSVNNFDTFNIICIYENGEKSSDTKLSAITDALGMRKRTIYEKLDDVKTYNKDLVQLILLNS